MTDDRLERALSDAIADLAGTGSPDYLDDILERTSRTRQRPWWTFPARYTTMATLKFATAASLAFVLGVTVSPLILPSDEGTASAPAGAVEPDATVATPMTEPPAHFTGRVEPGPIVSQPTSESRQYQADGLEWSVQSQTYGDLRSTVKSSDDRFSGQLTQDMAWDDYWLPDEDSAMERPRVMTQEWRLENDVGSWTGTLRTFFSGGQAKVFDLADAVVVLEGGGDYAGYTAIVHVDYEQTASYEWHHDLDCWIIEGGLPQG